MGLFGKSDERNRWPSAIATLDEVGVDGLKVFASGAYVVNGEYYSVQLERAFRSAQDAEAWAGLVEANPKVTVKFDPNNPSKHEVDSVP